MIRIEILVFQTLVSLAVGYGLHTLIFRTWENLWEAIKFWFKPDFMSWIDGEFWEDFWMELKLAILIGGMTGAWFLSEESIRRVM